MNKLKRKVQAMTAKSVYVISHRSQPKFFGSSNRYELLFDDLGINGLTELSLTYRQAVNLGYNSLLRKKPELIITTTQIL